MRFSFDSSRMTLECQVDGCEHTTRMLHAELSKVQARVDQVQVSLDRAMAIPESLVAGKIEVNNLSPASGSLNAIYQEQKT